MRVALDTNILVYALGLNDPDRRQKAEVLIAALSPVDLVIPAQALAELFRVLVRKGRWAPPKARGSILNWRAAYMVAPTLPSTIDAALDLAVNHRLSIFDAIILHAAAQANCRLLLSEDLQPGFVWQGTVVVNPFAKEQHPLLMAALAGGL